MEAGDIYTEPLRDDEEDGGRKRTGSSVGGGLRRLSGRMSSLSGSGSLSPGRLAGQFFSFDDELVLGGSDDEPDGEDSSRQTRGSSTLRRLSRRLSGGSLGRLSEIILSQITDEISSCDDDDADDDADDEVDEEEMRPGRQRGRRQQERRRSNSQGSRPPPQRRSSAATAASRASDDSSWAVGEAYDRAVRRLSRRSSLPLVRPASVTPSSTAIRAAQSSPAAAAAGRRISLPSPGPAGSSIGVGIGIHGHRRFRGEGAGSTSRWSSCPSAASASTCTRSTGPKSSGEESSVRDSIIHAAEGGSSSSPSSSQSSLRYWEIDGLERLLGGGGGGGDGSSRRVGSAHPNGDVGQKETILEYYVSKERAEAEEHYVRLLQQTERFQLFALIVDVGHAMKPTKLAVQQILLETTAKPSELRPLAVTNRMISIHVSEESGERVVMRMLAIVQYFLTLLQRSIFFSRACVVLGGEGSGNTCSGVEVSLNAVPNGCGCQPNQSTPCTYDSSLQTDETRCYICDADDLLNVTDSTSNCADCQTCLYDCGTCVNATATNDRNSMIGCLDSMDDVDDTCRAGCSQRCVPSELVA